MPNDLLARHFHARGLFGDLDFASMKETQPDELFARGLVCPTPSATRWTRTLDSREESIYGLLALRNRLAWGLSFFVEELTVFIVEPKHRNGSWCRRDCNV